MAERLKAAVLKFASLCPGPSAIVRPYLELSPASPRTVRERPPSCAGVAVKVAVKTMSASRCSAERHVIPPAGQHPLIAGPSRCALRIAGAFSAYAIETATRSRNGPGKAPTRPRGRRWGRRGKHTHRHVAGPWPSVSWRQAPPFWCSLWMFRAMRLRESPAPAPQPQLPAPDSSSMPEGIGGGRA